jgi:predicted DNA-binding transcriptional regulator AlpA
MTNQAANTPRVMRATEAARLLNMGASTLWRRAKLEPDFPKSFKLGERQTVWVVAELEAYIQRCAAKRGGSTI